MRSIIPLIFSAFCVVLLATPSARADYDDGRLCLSTQDARTAITQHHLADSAAVMRNAAEQAQADALSGRLCAANGRYVYEITLLRHDGHVIRVYVNASDGKSVGTQGGGY